MNRKITLLLITIIFFLALFLRLYHLGTVPHGYHQDEVANAYVGRYIFKNGVDLYGNRAPLLYFDKLGDYPPVLPMYITASGMFMFGNTPFATRLPIALIGTLALIPVFFIARLLFKSDRAGLIASLLLATAPWHVGFSRSATEGIIALTVYLYGFWLFLVSVRRNSIAYATGSLLLFLLTYLLYPGYRIFVPLTILVLLFCFYKKTATGLRYFMLLSLIVSVTLTMYISRTVWGQGRYGQTSILSYLEKNNVIGSYIANEPNALVAHIFNNKPLYFMREFMNQFFAYLTPTFLFLQGGLPPWFTIPNTGLLPFTLLIIIIFGLTMFVRAKHNPDSLTLLLLLAAAAIIPAALTNELTPHTHRSLQLIVPLILLATVSFEQILNTRLRYKRFIIGALGFLWFIEFILFSHNYFQHVSRYTSVSRSDANVKTAEFLKSKKDNYGKIYMLATGWMPAYYLFFTNNYDRNLAGKFNKNFRLHSLENIRFIDADCPNLETENIIENEMKNTKSALIIMSSSCKNIPAAYKEAGSIKDIASTVVYRTYEYSTPVLQ